MQSLPKLTIIRSFRNSIMLHITPTGELVVKAPHVVPKRIIDQFIDQKKNWIFKTIEKIDVQKGKKRKFTEGETFLYLGNEYTLTYSDGIEIIFSDKKLLFPKALLFRAKKELESWYIKRAKEKITQRVQLHAQRMNVSFTSILFSDTSSKWGTCFADNSLQFNWRLIMAPLMVLDYVIIHELAHTEEHNHGNRFWAIVTNYTLAYKQHKKWLTNNSGLLTLE